MPANKHMQNTCRFCEPGVAERPIVGRVTSARVPQDQENSAESLSGVVRRLRRGRIERGIVVQIAALMILMLRKNVSRCGCYSTDPYSGAILLPWL